jgi:choline dehydrogenase-like flavoprotein
MIYVVGSGPAGVSCARALLDGGLAVTLLDAGLDLESDRAQVLNRMRGGTPAEWDPRDLELIRRNTEAHVDGVPKKLLFGSDYPYRDAEEALGVRRTAVDCVPSFARGGLSTVWGASILPFRAEDIHDWPITVDDLAPHYRAVLSWMPHCAVEDGLAEWLPHYSPSLRSIPPSTQTARFLADLGAHRDVLRDHGIVFGRSRVAMNPDCVCCGLCMYGCPYEFIYTSSSTLRKLESHHQFRYVGDVVVDRVVEAGAEVTIHAHSRATGEPTQFRGSRVFLACGTISTTGILLESLEAYDRPVTLVDSQYFIVPVLRYANARGVHKESLSTLCQIFLEVLDSSISNHLVHLQFYGYNDLYEKSLRRLFGPLYGVLRGMFRELVARLWVVQGYLHSSISPTIRARLVRHSGSPKRTLHLERVACSDAPVAVQKVLKKLRQHRSQLRAVPLMPLLSLGNPGRGFHTGGAFPMRAMPGPFQSDRLGRPYGMDRVHAVDSTTFPSIPATTITLTVMANAHRIGTACKEL